MLPRFIITGISIRQAESSSLKVEIEEMGEKAKVKETVGLYSKVWQLPTFQGILLRILGMILMASLLISFFRVQVVPSSVFIDAFLHNTAIFGVTVFLSSGILYLLVRKEGSPLDPRRTFGATQFGTVLWLGFGVIGASIDAILGMDHYAIRLLILGMTLGYMMFAFLVTGLSDHHALRNLAAALVFPLTWFSLTLSLQSYTDAVPALPAFWLPGVLLMFGVASVSVYWIFKSVSRPFERDLGIDGPALLRAFGYDYLIGNPEPLERTLTEIHTKQDVRVEVMVLKSEGELFAVGVVLYIHPGPFRDIGSSGLPSEIIAHIREQHGVPAFVMHGTCTHHQNLTTKEDIPSILAEIDRLVREVETVREISGPHWTDLGKFKVWTLFVNDNALCITTSAPQFTDDISLSVGMDAAEMVRSRLPSINQVSTVDAHNCIDDEAVSVMKEDPEADDYVGAVSSAAFSTFNEPHHEVSAGIYRVTPDNIDLKDGLGPGGIVALVLRVGETESALLFIDGNNMEPGYRERAIGIIKEQGFDKVELTTTDTHVVNAISLSSSGYPPIGRHKPDDILESIITATTKARERLRPVEVGMAFGQAKNLRVFGEKAFDILTQDIVEAARIAKRVGLGAAGLTFLLSAVTVLLI